MDMEQLEASVPLTHSDRCDLCGARAYMRYIVNRDKSPLLFCHHHGVQYRPALEAKGAVCHDQTDLLNVKLDASA